MNSTTETNPKEPPNDVNLDHLSPIHLAMLREGSGISDEVIAARGYRTITNEKELIPLNFATRQRRTPGLLIPGHAPDGSNGFYTYRPDAARVDEDRRKRNPDGSFKQRVIKYEIPASAGVRLDCPVPCLETIKDPAVPVWITEGQKKADALASHGLCALALLGVWNFKGKNEFGGVTLLADWDSVALNGRDVRIVFDNDVMHKPDVRKSLDRMTEHLQRKGAHVSAVYLPGGRDAKIGVDDFLLTHTVEDLEALIDAPRPKATAAAPQVELLDEPPLVCKRPLGIVGEHAYAAIYPYVRVTRTESTDKDGNILKHNPPLVETERRLMLVRDDGVIFGEGGSQPIADLGFDVALGEAPVTDRLWSTPGVKAFRAGNRPKPGDVFNRVTDIIDRFISFKDSLADQHTMSEMVACYTLSTWFLDAFNVTGFLWSNGERGSGKTQLLSVVAEMAYLGQVILAGGSFAALRDMADAGAFLAFDDAENLSDPKQTDPDKRTLLLAGNRRGNTVPVKEPAPDRTWRTRYVNTFCPRAFSAIKLPDATLASRTIIVPLIRTPDPYRANADPLKYSLWTHDRRKLIDDLWATGLMHVCALREFETWVDDNATLAGRNLEPWRALLSVAAWLDASGVNGLWDRMHRLAVDYQSERHTMETDNLSLLVIRALYVCVAEADITDITDIKDITLSESSYKVKSADVVKHVREIAEELEVDIDLERLDNRRIGRVLGSFRLKQLRLGAKQDRGWYITADALESLASAYGLRPLNQPVVSESDVFDVSDVCDVCDDEVKR
ncbi:MAG: DUF3854 domain-containing protein [Pyrinomonadaceae bacterium]